MLGMTKIPPMGTVIRGSSCFRNRARTDQLPGSRTPLLWLHISPSIGTKMDADITPIETGPTGDRMMRSTTTIWTLRMWLMISSCSAC